MAKDDQILEEFTSREYEHGWNIDLESDQAPKGLNEDINMGKCHFPESELPGYYILLCPKAESETFQPQ